jgi:1-aminocyclopropane-1-carboxylate deaminase
MPFDVSHSILQHTKLFLVNNVAANLFIKRDDLIHPLVSGNKWRKLIYSLKHAENARFDGVLTFGGAYSNHLLATAAACNELNLSSIGIVRGEELTEASNSLLERCAELGMILVFVTREEYQMRDDKVYWEELSIEYPNHYIIPEGGANYYGIIGCQEIVDDQVAAFDHVFVAQGTTTTSVGLALALPLTTTLHVVPVLKGFDSIGSMRQLLQRSAFDQELIEDVLSRVVVHEEAHFGGYGKYTDELLTFMESFFRETGVPVDPIYTGKVVYAIREWMMKESMQDEKVIFIHTGGIEGGKSIAYQEGRTFF